MYWFEAVTNNGHPIWINLDRIVSVAFATKPEQAFINDGSEDGLRVTDQPSIDRLKNVLLYLETKRDGD